MSEGADLLDAGDGCLPDLGEGIAIALLVIAAALLFIFLGIPLLIALGELALLLVLFVIGVVTKVVFRRPWTVEAIDHTGERHAWRVVGWRASGEVRNLVAERVTTTGAVPTIAEVSMMAGVVAE
ncbi:MAG: hypothetical protein M9952_08900 [Microthrixaceae bacterium]|nr:hypothetical protein [Microthrixaceae bacterium]MCO5313035.1 hypothetical protein [Microthrixaceae bacterium]HPB45406.1 hypothetical protein [Microthrixaceae bacterium]